MIQQNELRRGNIVDVGNGIFDKVIEIYSDSISTMTKDNICEYHPITLTPEILNKCGLEEYPVRPSDEIMGVVYNCYCDGIGKISIESDGYCEYEPLFGAPKPIKYLHQLQNLHFALTGVELQIEL